MAIACCQKAKMKNSKPKKKLEKEEERKYGSVRSLDDAAPNVVLTGIKSFPFN